MLMQFFPFPGLDPITVREAEPEVCESDGSAGSDDLLEDSMSGDFLFFWSVHLCTMMMLGGVCFRVSCFHERGMMTSGFCFPLSVFDECVMVRRMMFWRLRF